MVNIHNIKCNTTTYVGKISPNLSIDLVDSINNSSIKWMGTTKFHNCYLIKFINSISLKIFSNGRFQICGNPDYVLLILTQFVANLNKRISMYIPKLFNILTSVTTYNVVFEILDKLTKFNIGELKEVLFTGSAAISNLDHVINSTTNFQICLPTYTIVYKKIQIPNGTKISFFRSGKLLIFAKSSEKFNETVNFIKNIQ